MEETLYISEDKCLTVSIVMGLTLISNNGPTMITNNGHTLISNNGPYTNKQ